MKLPIKNPLLFNAALAVVALILIFGAAALMPNKTAETSYQSPEVTYAGYSPAGLAGGAVVPASCESGYDHSPDSCSCVPYYGQGCTSAANACGQTTPGVYQCNGTCAANLNPVYLYEHAGYGGYALGFTRTTDAGGNPSLPGTSSINLNGAVSATICSIFAYDYTLQFDPWGAGWTYVWGVYGDSYNNDCITFYGNDDNFTDNRYPLSGALLNDDVYLIKNITHPTVSSPPDSNCPQPPGNFNLSVGGGLACNSVPLSWTAASGADGYRILKGSPRVDISPYQPYTALNFTDTNVSQNTTYQYQIEAYNGAGTNRSNEISPTTPYCLPTLNFSGNPTSIFEGQSTTLTWSSSYAASCTASGAWSGSKAANGSEVVIPSPPPSATFTLTCSGPGGSIGPQSVVINITPLALPNWREIIPR